jgi:hypothetical protein
MLASIGTPKPTLVTVKPASPVYLQVVPVYYQAVTPTPQSISKSQPAASSSSDTKIEKAISLMREIEQEGITTETNLPDCLKKSTNTEIINCLNLELNSIILMKQKNTEAGSLLSSAQPTSRYPSATLTQIRNIQVFQKYCIEYSEYSVRVMIADFTGGMVDATAIPSQVSLGRTYLQKATASLKQLDSYYSQIDSSQYYSITQGTKITKDSISKGYTMIAAYSAVFDGSEHVVKAGNYLKNKQITQAVTEINNALDDYNKAKSLGYQFSLPIEDLINLLVKLGYA